MKKQVQQPGVRKWFGDDWISMQDEMYAVLDGFYGDYGQQFILSGCAVNGNNISAGIVGLIDGSGFHLCRFAGIQGVAWPVYLYPAKITETRAYLDNQVKPVSETWTVGTSNQDEGGYFQLKQDGTSARFFDAIQTANRRFVTDAEKTGYAAQASAAITTIRGGVAANYDTMAKIVTAMLLLAAKDSPTFTGIPAAPTAAPGTNTTQLANTAFVQAAVAALVSSSPAALDTLNELATALGNDPNFATTITTALSGKEPANSNIQTHIASQTNPHNTTKAQVGLGNVDNTSDVNKPVSTAQQTALNLKANLASPALTGVPTAPTAAAGTNTTQLANTAFVQAAVAALVSSSPATLDTLNELAAALGNDANFATTMTNALAGKVGISDARLTDARTANGGNSDTVDNKHASDFESHTVFSDGYSGNINANDLINNGSYQAADNVHLTATFSNFPEGVGSGGFSLINTSIGSNYNMQICKVYNTNEIYWRASSYSSGKVYSAWRKFWHDGNFDPASKADLASPAFTGTPTTPTPAPGTNTTQVVNAAFVQAAIAALVASSPATLDTLNELAAALGNDANFATTMTNALANKLNRNFDNISSVVGALTALNVEGSAVLAGTDIDWSGKPIRTKTLTGATTFTFSNLIINKTITLRVTGAFTLILPTSVSMVSGTYDGTKINLIQLLCVDSATPEIWCSISQKQ